MTKPLEAGRQLDELVAVYVMGLPDVRWRRGTLCGESRDFLEYGEEFMPGVVLQVPAYSL